MLTRIDASGTPTLVFTYDIAFDHYIRHSIWLHVGINKAQSDSKVKYVVRIRANSLLEKQ